MDNSVSRLNVYEGQRIRRRTCRSWLLIGCHAGHAEIHHPTAAASAEWSTPLIRHWYRSVQRHSGLIKGDG